MPCILCGAPAVAWADVDTPVCAECERPESPEALRERLESEWEAMIHEGEEHE